MNFEKENKPQRKTRVLQRRPGRSSTRKASTAALHYRKLSCQENKQQENHHHVGPAAKPGVSMGLERTLAVGDKVKHTNTCQHTGLKHLLYADTGPKKSKDIQRIFFILL